MIADIPLTYDGLTHTAIKQISSKFGRFSYFLCILQNLEICPAKDQPVWICSEFMVISLKPPLGYLCVCMIGTNVCVLTHRSLDKMAAISETFSNEFSCLEMY